MQTNFFFFLNAQKLIEHRLQGQTTMLQIHN